MKIVLFNGGRPGLLKDGGVVDISDAVARLGVQSGQAAMEAIITHMDSLRDDLSRMERQGSVTPLSEVSLQPPLPRPKKVMCMGGNYREFGAREPSPMWGFLKSSQAVIGPGDTVVLPPEDINIFHHEAELVVVFGSAGKDVTQANAMDHVFGYTAGVDVSARLPADRRGGGGGARNTTSMPVSPWNILMASCQGTAPLNDSPLIVDNPPPPRLPFSPDGRWQIHRLRRHFQLKIKGGPP